MNFNVKDSLTLLSMDVGFLILHMYVDIYRYVEIYMRMYVIFSLCHDLCIF